MIKNTHIYIYHNYCVAIKINNNNNNNLTLNKTITVCLFFYKKTLKQSDHVLLSFLIIFTSFICFFVFVVAHFLLLFFVR